MSDVACGSLDLALIYLGEAETAVTVEDRPFLAAVRAVLQRVRGNYDQHPLVVAKDLVLNIRCLLCGAPAGHCCATSRGAKTSPHDCREKMALGEPAPKPCACRADGTGWRCFRHDPRRNETARKKGWI